MISRRTEHALALTLVAATLGPVGCGGSSSSPTPHTTSAPTPGAPPAAARFVVGRWHGELHQRGLAPFQVKVTIASLSDSSANPVHYGGLGCGGHWTYLGTAGETVRFREVIDSGRSATCKGIGEVTLVRAGAGLRYQFNGGGVVSRGLLTRG